MNETKTIRVYVAGPFTNGNQFENVRAAILIADQLAAEGFVPYIPHLTAFWHFVKPHTHADWVSYDLQWLVCCDCLFKVVSDVDSVGVSEEETKAREQGKPIFHTIPEIRRHYGKEVSLPISKPKNQSNKDIPGVREFQLDEAKNIFGHEGSEKCQSHKN